MTVGSLIWNIICGMITECFVPGKVAFGMTVILGAIVIAALLPLCSRFKKFVFLAKYKDRVLNYGVALGLVYTVGYFGVSVYNFLMTPIEVITK